MLLRPFSIFDISRHQNAFRSGDTMQACMLCCSGEAISNPHPYAVCALLTWHACQPSLLHQRWQ